MSLTNFEKVGQFHETFGHPKRDKLQKNLLTEDPEQVQFRLNLIHEEVRELVTAVKDKNLTEVIDGLTDILYVVYGMGHVFGIDLDRAFQATHDSNMSKLCKSEQEAIDSVEYYKKAPAYKLDVSYRPAVDSGYVIYDKATGKILKSKYFTRPDFSSILSTKQSKKSLNLTV